MKKYLFGYIYTVDGERKLLDIVAKGKNFRECEEEAEKELYKKLEGVDFVYEGVNYTSLN